MENKMDNISELILNVVKSIVDEPDSATVSVVPSQKGNLYEVHVGVADTGKIIGKQGRVANAIRTIAKAAGAKARERVMVNILNK
jgi:hypothetical protein